MNIEKHKCRLYSSLLASGLRRYVEKVRVHAARSPDEEEVEMVLYQANRFSTTCQLLLRHADQLTKKEECFEFLGMSLDVKTLMRSNKLVDLFIVHRSAQPKKKRARAKNGNGAVAGSTPPPAPPKS